MAGGLRPTSCPLPPSVGRYGQHQGYGYARNAHPLANERSKAEQQQQREELAAAAERKANAKSKGRGQSL